jgi:hypothetical protein
LNDNHMFGQQRNEPGDADMAGTVKHDINKGKSK